MLASADRSHHHAGGAGAQHTHQRRRHQDVAVPKFSDGGLLGRRDHLNGDNSMFIKATHAGGTWLAGWHADASMLCSP